MMKRAVGPKRRQTAERNTDEFEKPNIALYLSTCLK